MKLTKEIPGWAGIYLIHTQGYVINKNTTVKRVGGITKQGYRRITISRGNKRVSYQLHRLVAEAFIPNPNNLPEVNHIDGNKLNNHVSNLEWVTPTGNREHYFKTKTMAKTLEDVKSQVRQELSTLCQGLMNKGLISGYNIISSEEFGDISINIRPKEPTDQLQIKFDTTKT